MGPQNEADWMIQGVKADIRELETVIVQGEADAEQVAGMAAREPS